MDITKLVEDMNPDSITMNNLDEYVELETNKQSALDRNAP